MRGRWRWGPEPPIRARPRPPIPALIPPNSPCQGTAKAGKPDPLSAGRPRDEADTLHGPPPLELRRGSPASAGPFLHAAPPPPSHRGSPGACPADVPPSQAFSRTRYLGRGRGQPPPLRRCIGPPPRSVLRRHRTDLSTWTGREGCSHGYGRPPRAAPPPPVVKGVRVQSGWQVDQVAREDSWVQMCLLRGDMCYLDM